MSDADIIARVRFYETAEGGRAGPTPPDRFGCLLVVGSSCFDCRLLLAETGALHPGQSATVPIKFLAPELVKDLLAIGSQFLLRDSNVIAEGQVQAVFFD